jgi:PPOX class probable F420-dependent enzyme
VRSRFESARVARLATINPSGGVDLVPVTFAFLDDDTIVTAIDHKPKTTRELHRLRNIERDPRVTVLADHYDEDWTRLWWLRARGHATVERSGPLLARSIDALQGRYAQYVERPPDGPAIVIRVEEWRGWAADPD